MPDAAPSVPDVPPPPETVRLLWTYDFLDYDFGIEHPMSPVRLDLTIALVRELGLAPSEGVTVVEPVIASDETIARIHEPAYIAAVRAVSAGAVPDESLGLGTQDDPVFPAMHEASARIYGASCDAAAAVWSGAATHAINVAGGMHHAMPGAAAGFCVYNDAAGAVRRLLDDGAQRVAYVDLDAHHGDGVELAFRDDPRVLTFSVHQNPMTLFPGTGFATDTGGPGAPGSAVNLALPPRTDAAGWLRAIDAVLPHALRAFAPEVIVSQHGCDSHRFDPLSDLRTSVAAQRTAAVWVHELAHELCGGRWVALGGGGYAVVRVVPFAWTGVLAEAAHRPFAPGTPVPPAWRARAQEMTEDVLPTTMDWPDVEFAPWSAGYDPGVELDRAVQATRSAAFPLLGLDPHH
ncbi:acetoin utilization protein AcuC [Cellulomonas sp. PhB143]|uniref:acetoin utilization protein AcuC n=1 Tax=Cellulomonas sp. PhB143 TaxID=2485186 RepID=UPI000F46B7F9|nr:acetoin utilization protein AcuC [Cellulomonas sp. PhB143]ROS76678.1 acetoin utilization protein AcuC [Cellulomonas sp. PhB143]